MDKLDRLSACAVVVLLIWTVILVVQEAGKPAPEGQGGSGAGRSAVVPRYLDPAFDAKMTLVKKLIAAGNVDNAANLLDEVISAYPYEALPYMLKGDVALRRQEVIAAVAEYRKAVDLNPDFLDKKSRDFQGKKIKKTVEEASSILENAGKKEGSTESLEKNKQLIYYMLRKIAGSCS